MPENAGCLKTAFRSRSEPKVFDVLTLLVENNGHLVEKDELLRIVWADSFVEEQNIARVIYTLRRVLGEDENGNKFIETVPKKGYRFIAKVTEEGVSDGQEGTNGSGGTVVEEIPKSHLAASREEETGLPDVENAATEAQSVGSYYSAWVFCRRSRSFSSCRLIFAPILPLIRTRSNQLPFCR